jgi:hypothetical protein
MENVNVFGGKISYNATENTKILGMLEKIVTGR